MRKLALALLIFAVSPGAWCAEAKQWNASIPKAAAESGKWRALVAELEANEMPISIFAAAARMVTFFKDVETKELAYRSVIKLSERGFPFSIQPLFLPADLTPVGDPDFVDAYNIYKSNLNQSRGMEEWAKRYADAVDQKESPKFLFYSAIEAYSQKNLAAAEEKLVQILGRDLGVDRAALVTKSARTLARIYFERKQYSQSYLIYKNFLLKLNSIQASDWMEAAWNLYYLGKYPEALGMLYNLESKSASNRVYLERYTLRGLIYRKLCLAKNAENLMLSFQAEFGKIIDGVRLGEPLVGYPRLAQMDVPGNQEFLNVTTLMTGLQLELRKLPLISKANQPLATYLLQTEFRYLAKKRRSLMNEALARSAKSLVLMTEHLKFLRYDVERAKFNPDVVFSEAARPKSTAAIVEMPSQKGYRIHWAQLGDFWRDERNLYQANLESQCEKP